MTARLRRRAVRARNRLRYLAAVLWVGVVLLFGFWAAATWNAFIETGSH